MSDLISRQNAIKGVKELFACADIGNDECDITYMLENLPSADRPKNMIHIDEVYRLIAGHSDYHGDSILSAFTCLVEGKDVKSIAPLDESADRPTGWIPIKWHEITEEEREREGYPKDWVVYLDCEMPSDEQKILVTTRWGAVEADVCYEDGEFSLDSGCDWIDDIIAWMPLPKPYKGGESDG